MQGFKEMQEVKKLTFVLVGSSPSQSSLDIFI
jgi:hypothetical protein